MKLVELLAREWSEWPGNCDYAVCDSDGEIRAIGTGTNNDFYPADAVDLEDRLNGTALLVSDDGKRVIRTDWAAERARIAKPAKKADKDGWIRHRGGKCPVKIGTPVDVRYRDGNIHMDVPAQTIECRADNWLHTDDKNSFDAGCDIMAYRLHKPAEQVEACSKPELRSLPENYGEIIGGSVEGPIQWRDRITEIDATTQALTAERADLVNKLASEGFALIGRVVEPVEDYGNIQIGDLVSVISICGFSDRTGLSVGDIAEVTSVDNDESIKTVSGGSWGSIGYNYKFHSRPSA